MSNTNEHPADLTSERSRSTRRVRRVRATLVGGALATSLAAAGAIVVIDAGSAASGNVSTADSSSSTVGGTSTTTKSSLATPGSGDTSHATSGGS